VIKSRNISKERWLFFFKLIFSLIIFIYVVQKYEIKKEFFSVFNFDKYIIFYVIICPVSLSLINSFIQYFGFEKLSMPLSIQKILKSNYSAPFFGVLLPSTIGADAYLTYSYGKNSKNYSKVISNLLIARILGFVVFAFLFILLNLKTKFIVIESFFDDGINLTKSLTLLFVVTLVIIISLLLIYRFQIFILDKFRRIKSNLLVLIRPDSKLIFMIVLTVFWYFISVGIRYLVTIRVGIHLNPLLIITLIISINFILMLPLTILGIGIRELSYVGLFALFGIKAEQALILAATDLLMNLVAVFFGGAIFIISRTKK